MKGKQHLLAASVCALTAIDHPELAVGILIGSLLPDIDTEESTLGHMIPVFPRIINRRFGHRTVTHNILFASVFLILAVILKSGYSLFNFGLFIGIMTHLILDSTTKGGVRWFYPLPFSISLTKLRSNSFLCWFLAGVEGFIMAVILLGLKSIEIA